LGVIAEGGQGLIARARDRETGELVAVKMLTSAAAQNDEFVQRLAREQEAMLALAGTSAVAVLDLCRAPGGAPCLVMELLEGHDLERELGNLESARQYLPVPRLYEIFEAIVETLERAHEAGILHRDLKPANIFLLSAEAGGGVRLLDFGLSRMKKAAPLTQLGTILGSPSYIAPEVWGGRTDVLDQRVDVYSLSVVLFRALAGRLPFEAASVHEKFQLATSAPRPNLTPFRPDLPEEVDVWVQKALAINPADRYSSVREAWSALLEALDYTPTHRQRPRVRESLVDAWRAARGAFRRALTGLPMPAPARPPTSPPPRAQTARPPLVAPSRGSSTSPPPALAPSRPPVPGTIPPPQAPTRKPPPPPKRASSRAPAPTAPTSESSAEWLLDSDVLTSDDGVSLADLFDETAAQAPGIASVRDAQRRRRRASRAVAEPGASELRRKRVRRARQRRRY
jgi:serine/threonine-protein kinase